MATNPTPEDDHRSSDERKRTPRLDMSRRDRFVYDEDDTVFVTYDPRRPDADKDRSGDSTD